MHCSVLELLQGDLDLVQPAEREPVVGWREGELGAGMLQVEEGDVVVVEQHLLA